MSEFTSKVHLNPGGDVLVVESGGMIEVQEGGEVSGLTVEAATATELGGIKAAAKGAGDTVEAKIGTDKKLYVAPYALPAATAEALGGIVAAACDPEGDYEEALIGTDNKLYVPRFPVVQAQEEVAAGAALADVITALNALMGAMQSVGLMRTPAE